MQELAIFAILSGIARAWYRIKLVSAEKKIQTKALHAKKIIQMKILNDSADPAVPPTAVQEIIDDFASSEEEDPDEEYPALFITMTGEQEYRQPVSCEAWSHLQDLTRHFTTPLATNIPFPTSLTQLQLR